MQQNTNNNGKEDGNATNKQQWKGQMKCNKQTTMEDEEMQQNNNNGKEMMEITNKQQWKGDDGNATKQTTMGRR